MQKINKNCCRNGFNLLLFVYLIGFVFCAPCSFLFPNLPSANNNKNINLTAKNVLLEDCLKTISSQTNINFVYSAQVIGKIKITCSFKNIPLDEVLQKLLYKKGLGYKYSNPVQIIIFEDKNVKIGRIIEGIVSDSKSGESLPYVFISIDEGKANTIANSQGEFSLFNIPPGIVQISFRRIGYNTLKLEIDPDTLEQEKIKIGMVESAIMFEPVFINAENADVFRISEEAGSFSMSPRNNSILPGIGFSDISRTLQSVPGIGTASFGSSGLNIRGGIPSQNLVLFDGIVLYHMNHSFGYFNSFNSAAIKDVQVYKGGYPAKFGGRLSGVVELTAKNGDVNTPHIDLGINQMNTQGLVELPLFGKGAVLFSARRSISGFVLNSLYEKVYYSFRDNFSSFEPGNQSYSELDSKVYFYDLLGKITLLPTDDDVVTLSGFSSFDKFENGRKQTKEQAQLNENAETKNEGYSAKWYRKWSGGFYTTLLGSHSDYSTDNNKWWKNKIVTDTILVNTVKTVNHLKELAVSLDNEFDINTNNSINFGLAYSRISTDFNFGLEYLPLFRIDAKRKLNNESVELTSFYMQDKWGIWESLKSNIGLRVNKYQASSNPDFEPRISFNWNLNSDISVKCAFGKYYQYIMQYEDFANLLQGRVSWISADNKEVKPSSSTHYIVGAKYEKEGFLIDAELFYKKLYDVPETLYEWRLSERFPNSLQVVQNNGEAKGLDLLLKKNAGFFFGWISYSYCTSESHYTINSTEKTAPSSNDSPHKIDIVLNIKWNDFTFSTAWHYLSGRPYSMPGLKVEEFDGRIYNYYVEPEQYNDHRFPASHQLDLSVMYTHVNNYFTADCGISIFNIYDRKNIWFSSPIIKNAQLNKLDVYMLGFTPTFFLDVRI